MIDAAVNSPSPANTHRAADLRLLGVLVAALAPHVAHLPPWVMLFAAAVIAWQFLSIARNWPLPGRQVRLILCVLAVASVYLGFGQVNGQRAGVSLLVLMLALKLTELRTHRDRSLTLFLAYFVLITQFLFSQSIAMGFYLLFTTWLITASLLEINHRQGPLPLRRSLGSAAAIMGQSLPLMVLLFVLFPRIPGPLWGLPPNNKTAQTGLSDRMAPGSLARLVKNNGVAFRASFSGKAPPRRQRYWRGPVLENYNGTAWTRAERRTVATPAITANGRGRRYEVIMEPTGTRRLPVLSLPVSGPRNAVFTADGQMLAKNPVKKRRLYHARSVINYRFEPHLSPAERRRDLAVPAGIDPQSRELVRKWKSRGLRGTALAQRILRLFHNQPFFYTLKPAPLPGPNKVDRFLFHTRHGFCEHYASAFTVLMRMAGIPARVVTGYLGGEFNSAGGYLIVRHSNAHAWSEIWRPGRGWLRYNPTAAIAAQRVLVDQPAGSAARTGAGNRDGFRRGPWHRLALHWDWVQTTWDRTLLAYGPELQSAFLGKLGLPDWRSMILALTVLSVGFLSFLGSILMWRARPRHRRSDATTRAWQRVCRRLARQGLPRWSFEGPRDYARRIAKTRPALAEEIHAIAGLYIELRYGENEDGDMRSRFLHRVRAFHTK